MSCLRTHLLASCLALVMCQLATGEPPPPNPKPPGKDDHGDLLPPGSLARLGTVRFRHGGWVVPVLFSPDGKLIASAGSDRVIRLWDPATGREVRSLTGHAGFSIISLAFSPDGTTLASGGWDDVTRVWDVATGKELRQVGKAPTSPTRLAFSPDGAWLATGEKVIRIWDVKTWRELLSLGGNEDHIYEIAFTPDGKSLVSCDDRGGVRLWDLAERREVRTFRDRESEARAFSISPDGKRLAAGEKGWRVIVRDIATGQELWQAKLASEIGSGNVIGCVQFSPDGKVLATSGQDNLSLWDAATGKKLHQLAPAGTHFWGISFSPDGETLAAGVDNGIRLWAVATGKEVRPSEEPYKPVSALAFSPDGKRLAIGMDGEVRVHEVSTRERVRRIAVPQIDVSRVRFSPDGTSLAVEDRHESGCLWDLAAGNLTQRWGEHEDRALDVPFEVQQVAPDLRTRFSWFEGRRRFPGQNGHPEDDVVRRFDVGTGKELERFQRHPGEPASAAISPEGTSLVFAYGNSGLRLYNLPGGREDARFGALSTPARRVEYSTDGRSIGVADDDGTFRVLELATGKERCRLATDLGKGLSFALSPDGGRVATWAWDTPVVSLWDIATGKEVRRLSGHRSGVRQVAFSPDGKLLASASGDTTVLLWDVAGPPQAAPRPLLSPKELDRLWAELADGDAATAFRAMRVMEAAGKQFIATARERLEPIRPIEPGRLDKLLADLDSDRFEERERAARELEQVVEVVVPQLKRAAEQAPSLEMRRRLETLLDRREGGALRPDTVQALRAVEVLERIGGEGAAEVLKVLSRGAAEAALTRAAKTSLQRLDRGAPRTP